MRPHAATLHFTDIFLAADSQTAQTDGASEMQMGGALLEPEFDVNVKLNDLQADPHNPLFSVKNFQDLHL